MKKALTVLAALAAITMMGCDPGTVSQDDMDQMRKEMGTEAYEKAMKDAGKGDELEAQKAADAARMAEEGGQ